MLFNSYIFIFCFLIPVFIMYRAISPIYKVSFLVLASIVFYAQWSLEHLLILLGSIIFNYIFVKLFLEKQKKAFNLFMVIVLNLIPLVYYKYSNFLHLSENQLLLPLAISFFTFQQIAFGVDVYKGKVKVESFEKYSFFILFFPQLIAGPIVHYNELIGQIEEGTRKNSAVLLNLQEGVILFCIGLFKKVVLADSLAVIANDGFSGISGLSSYEAWIGLFGYSFQIYFDFSGYADMAIGLALMFGFRLPVNFNSPYKSENIIEFWRNWHITLSNFLRDHIYIPLGGNRYGNTRAFINVFITMVIGGIWHGAGWNFLVWGGVHGLLIGVVHLKIGTNIGTRINSNTYISTYFTFVCVTLLWVLFRAENLDVAVEYYGRLFDLSSFGFKSFGYREMFLICSLVIVWFLPNSQTIASKFITIKSQRYHLWYGVFVGVLFFVALKFMADIPSLSFVYFNF